MFWGLRWKGSPQFLDEGWREQTDIVIGCVDSRKARRAITNSRSYWESHYWLDIGNNADTGQFVLGQPENRKNQKAGSRLPTVAELFPEIINSKLDKTDKLPSCSAVEALERQEPFVNQTLAYQATGDACAAVPIRAAVVPRWVRESALGSHNPPSCGSVRADSRL